MKTLQRVTGGVVALGIAIGVAINYVPQSSVDGSEGHSIVFPEPEASQPPSVPVNPEEFDILPVLPMIDGSLGGILEVEEISFPEQEIIIQSPKSCPPTSSRRRGLFGSIRGGFSVSR